MLFSIATPALNSLPELRQCIGSVRAQPDVEVEHLIQDGGSDDGTVEFLANRPDLHSASQPDNGMYDAINRAWARSNGDILSWLNTDEQYLEGTLDAVSKAFSENPDIDAVFGNVILVDPSGAPVAARREIPLRRWYVANGILYAQSCTTFIRRRVRETHGLLDTRYRIVGDLDWILRLLDNNVRFLHLDRYLGLFTVGTDNLSLSTQAAKELADVRDCHAAHRSPALRFVARACRWLEKAGRGCYGTRRVQYRYMQDEDTERYIDTTIGTRWRWQPGAARP
jgi:glycosyltransferase involved in cell wall biosynthesis